MTANHGRLTPFLLALLGSWATHVAGQPAANRVHAVGYSLSANAICGTHGLFFRDEAGQECDLYAEYGGGTLENWWSQIGPPPGAKWQLFQTGIELNGQPPVIWWQIAYNTQSSARIKSQDLTWLSDVLDEIRARAPQAVIYVSGMTSYTPFACPVTNQKAINKSWNAAERLLATQPDVFMGPKMPDVTPEHSNGSADPCHLNAAGRAAHGALLTDFFAPLLAE
jgi:hypothetical protein